MPYPNVFSKYWYYFCSFFTLLIGISNPLKAIAILISPQTNTKKMIYLRNGLHFAIRSKMDIWIIKETILDQCYQKELIKFQDGGKIIDIGAAFGDFSVFMAKTYPQGRILAFEPNHESYELAVLNTNSNSLRNIQLYNKAIGPTDHFTACHSRESGNLIHVSLQTILKDFEYVDLIKMDCEGGEYDILLNLAPEVLAKIKNLAIEWHDNSTHHRHDELVVYLKKCAFDVKVHLNPVHADIGLIFACHQHEKL